MSGPAPKTTPAEATFAVIFSPLAHHFFPDGCVEKDAIYWPERVSHEQVSYDLAKESLTNLRCYAESKGLTPNEMHCVAIVACSTLPRKFEESSKEACYVRSKFVDGTSSVFCALIRECMLPLRCCTGVASNVDKINGDTIVMLLSVADRCDGNGKATVCRFLTLLARNDCLSYDNEGDKCSAMQVLSNLYAIPFSMLSDPIACKDAVRLLYHLTRKRHVVSYRAKCLRDLYASEEEKSSPRKHGPNRCKSKFASVIVLMQLYDKYDPIGCRKFVPRCIRLGGTTMNTFFRVPDEEWCQKFANLKNAGSFHAENDISSPKRAQHDLIDSAERVRNDSNTIANVVESIFQRLDGASPSSWSLLENRGAFGVVENRQGPVRASDILNDISLRHLLLLSCKDTTSSDDRYETVCPDLARLRACLPYMLFDEWYECDDGEQECNEAQEHHLTMSKPSKRKVSPSEISRENSRSRLLQGLSSFARHADLIPPEAESFICDHVLPNFDGNDRLAEILLTDVLAVFKPTNFKELEKRILKHLKRLYVTGSPRLKYVIISGALSSIFGRWGLINRDSKPHVHTLGEIIEWTDNMLLLGLVSEGGCDGGGHELIRLSAVDFFQEVCNVYTKLQTCTIIPSPSLTYRLLLANTALSIDRVCLLLLDYRNIFLKSQGGIDMGQNKEVDANYIHRMTIFNCFVWDFCSALWRCSPLPHNETMTELAQKHSILFTDLPSEVIEELHLLPNDFAAKTSLSITHGSVFAGYASMFLEKHFRNHDKINEDESLRPDLLKGKVKVKYLESLPFEGMKKFLNNFVSSLVEREKKRAKRKVKVGLSGA